MSHVIVVFPICRVLCLSLLFASLIAQYTTVLCYVVGRANPPSLLSNLAFIQIMHPRCRNIKAFVDFCVAVKYLLKLRPRRGMSGECRHKEEKWKGQETEKWRCLYDLG